MIASPGPGAAVGGSQQRVDLVLAEVGDHRAVEAFGWYRQHPGNDRGILGVLQRGVAEQRVDRGEAGVAGPGTVAAFGLQVVKERADQGCVQIQAERPLGVPDYFAQVRGGRTSTLIPKNRP